GFDEFRFYYYYNLDTYTTTYGITADSLKENEETFKTFLSDVVLCIKQELVAEELAEENGIELTEEDQKTIDETIENAKSTYDSEEAYLADLKNAYLTEDLYRRMLERAQIYSKVMETLFENDGKYATPKEEFKKIVQDEEAYAHEIHVMVPFYSQVELDDSAAEGYDDLSLSEKVSAKSAAYDALDEEGKEAAKESAKAVADEVCKKAADGEDFEELIKEYGWDLGLEDPSNGYYISSENKGGYPDELVTEAFDLAVGETSDEPVMNSIYGYFIVKRIEPDMDYVEENIDTMIKTYDSSNIQKVFQEQIDKMNVTYCDSWDKIDANSVV
ncbi:MAG: peptidylprolyl isomerase, partial [Ruminococcus sp.]|nr:peptidylprolyl isomerase [Ruminococcus sp.]